MRFIYTQPRDYATVICPQPSQTFTMIKYLNSSPQTKRRKKFLNLTKGGRVGKAVAQKLNHVTSMQTGTLPRAQVPFRVRAKKTRKHLAKKTCVSICYYL